MFKRFTVETNQKLTSKALVAKPKDKWLPTKLLPWAGFLDQQKAVFERLQSTFPDDKRAFMTENYSRGVGDDVGQMKAADEKQLERLLGYLVGRPVSSIVEQLVKENAAKDEFKLGEGIELELYPNDMGDMGQEPLYRRGDPNLQWLRADQICAYKKSLADLGERALAFVIEYKPPHKLPLPHLRHGLREMDIEEEVVNRVTTPNDGQERF